MADPRTRTAAAALAALLAIGAAGCANIAAVDRAWFDAAGEPVAMSLGCPPLAAVPGIPGALAADRALSVVSWNIHRNGDPGWEQDLATFAAASDLVILQEATLTTELRDLLWRAGRQWAHADAWEFDGVVSGVLTASSVLPSDACVRRQAEPLLGLPKSALVTWYRIDGRADTLAVANVHSINFTFDLGAYGRQLDAVADVLSTHRGPAILAGDFNTWTPLRRAVLSDVAARLGLAEAVPRRGERSRFLGLPADYLFVRGLLVNDVWVESVDSSDHAPIRATLRFADP
ncbi:hypothetical protein BURK1_00184 [Burkholderiales bacterium]|nr:hypothetical protein BURK1_00184 [Burkholderiales bacterium]